MHKTMVWVCWCLGLILLSFGFAEQNKESSVQVSTVTLDGWARNMINTTLFRHNSLHIFVQKVEQGDGEKTMDIPPQPIRVLHALPDF